MPVDWNTVVIPTIRKFKCQYKQVYIDDETKEIIHSDVNACNCYKCSKCGFTSDKKYTVIKHLMEHIPFYIICDYRITRCSVCGMTVGYKELQYHVEIHQHFDVIVNNDCVDYICYHCHDKITEDFDEDEGYPVFDRLVTHTRRHTQVKNRCKIFQLLCDKGVDSGSAQVIAQKAFPIKQFFSIQ